jgi:hypothetical protein
LRDRIPEEERWTRAAAVLLGVLRKAFQETLRDPAFLADADKAKLEVDPVAGEDLERIVEGLFKIEPALVVRLKAVLID